MKPRTLTLCMLLFAAGHPAHAQNLNDYETPPVLTAADVLPPSLIKGENFRVQDGVTWKEGLHVFTVESKYGEFTVWGEPMLRVRLREVNALDILLNTSSTSVGMKSAGRTIGSSFRSLGNALAHPVRTGKALPGGLKRMFKSVKYDVQDISSTSKTLASGVSAEGNTTTDLNEATAYLGRQMAGINDSYRKWAENVGVNPFTSNEAIRAELDRISKVDSGVKIGTKIFAPSVVPEELKIITDVAKTAYHKDWRLIIEDNIQALAKLGVSPDLKARYISNPVINLTISTLLIELLEAMEGAEDRQIVIEQASLLRTEAEAAFFAETLMMAHWFHTNIQPAKRMLGGTLIPVILTRNGRIIAFSASDFEYWTAASEAIAHEFTSQYNALSPTREVWVADNVSPGYVRGISNLGWSVRSDLRAKVLPEIPWGIQDEGN